MDRIKKKRNSRIQRHRRLRKKVFGTGDRLRLSVFRSLKNISAQLIDDSRGITLLGLSSLSKEVKKNGSGKIEESRQVGLLLAKMAQEKGILRVVFDRGGYLFHGRVKSLAEGARKGGLKF
ncbi:50S ribosomal protein L18 [candidate division TA06 bacterium]|nr:50S ribosomal protein L18 [candidate division TA06 bacterium]